MKYAFLILMIPVILLCSSHAFSQTYSSIIPDEEIYGFLNWMTKHTAKYPEAPRLKRKQVANRILNWDTANFIPKESDIRNDVVGEELDRWYLFKRSGGTDTLFTRADQTFLFRQFTAIKDSIWHTRFSGAGLLQHMQQRRPNRYYYSVPLFTADRNYVIVYCIYYCGNLCAYGGYDVYRKTGKRKWKFVASVNTWIS